MDANTLVGFLGYSSSHPDLDDFLVTHGFPKRLTAKNTPVGILRNTEDSASLTFTASYEDQYATPLTGEGFLWLETVDFFNDSQDEKTSKYQGNLPLGLNIEMSAADVVGVLGKPDNDAVGLGGRFLRYNNVMGGLRLNIKFDKQGEKILFVRFMPKKK